MDNIFINIADFPIKGFNFPDITPLFESHPQIFKSIIDYLTDEFKETPPDYILCIESFGYLFGAPLAYNIGSKIVLCRKINGLPRERYSQKYDMCYDNDRTMEIHKEAINKNSSVLIIDDFLASGGTSKAAIELVCKSDSKVTSMRFIAEIVDLNGLAMLNKHCDDIKSIYKIRLDSKSIKWVILNSKI